MTLTVLVSAVGAAVGRALLGGTVVAVVAAAIGSRCRNAPTRHAAELGGLGLMAVWFGIDVVAHVGTAGGSPGVAGPATAPLALGWVYVALFGACAVRLALGAREIVRLRRSARAVPEAWVERVEALARRIGLTPPRIAASDRVDAPLVVGWLRPLVLVPLGWFTAMPPSTIEAVLLHELWHVRRRDVLLGYVQAVLELALCFHPAAWWLSHRARVSREHCCDDAAAQRLGVRRYAAALLQAEEARSLVLAPGFGGGQLRDRIARLLGRRLPRSRALFLFPILLAVGLSAPTRHASAELQIPWLPARVAAWEGALVEAGERHGVDPELLAIVALVESEGNPAAVSPVGATGLLQLMPSTAADVARRRGLPPPSQAHLFDPDINADYGAYYLARQLDTFGDVDLAAAAYNGGPTRARSWLEGRTRLPRETEDYRQLVSALYRERHDSYSPAFARLAARRGY